MKKNKPKKASFSKYVDYDEKLLFASRAGNFSAGSELLKRFFGLRYLVGNSVSPTLVKLLDSWEFNHAFFDAYNTICKCYKHNKGATVKTYFSRVFKNALVYEAATNQVFQRLNILSFDEEMHSLEGDEYTLSDIVPADSDIYNDVVYYVDYIDSLERFTKKDYGFREIDKAIIKLRAEGFSYEEIGKTLSITKNTARRSFQKFYRLAVKTIKTNSIDKIKDDFEKLL